MSGSLLSPLEALRDALGQVRMPLLVPGADAARGMAGSFTNQLDDYILPRLRDADAPLLAVVGGSTGSGKSTLVNRLVGTPVTTPGVLRPTTRHPVLVHNPVDTEWFAADHILPDSPFRCSPPGVAMQPWGFRLGLRKCPFLILPFSVF